MNLHNPFANGDLPGIKVLNLKSDLSNDVKKCITYKLII